MRENMREELLAELRAANDAWSRACSMGHYKGRSSKEYKDAARRKNAALRAWTAYLDTREVSK